MIIIKNKPSLSEAGQKEFENIWYFFTTLYSQVAERN